ncbi:MAG: terpene cyclase/mutase family protein [Thermoflexales bacterium]|nr:terpene cyclase/mutase family protein [Thermoflexales bacterium]
MKRAKLVFSSLGLGLVSVAILLLAFTPAQAVAPVEGDTSQLLAPAEADVVVQFGLRALTVRHITFTAPISGLAALQLTSLNVGISNTSFGPAVCSIEGIGCPIADCFCSANYWGYYHWVGSTWQGYGVGAGSSVITDGGVEGWRWGPWGGTLLFPELPPAPPVLAASDALAWLLSQQAADGGYGSVGGSVETALAIGANLLEASGWRRTAGTPSLLSYLSSHGAAFAKGADASGKLAVGLTGASGCWPQGALEPMDFYSPTTGALALGSGQQAWAMLGIAALDQNIPAAAIDHLKSLRQANGAWEWQPGLGTDTNSTALAIQALAAAGEPLTSSIIVSALNYLKSAQNADGGFAYDPNSAWGRDSDTNSSAYVVQALIAAGQDPTTSTWTISHTHPISFLLGMQLPDGSFEWQKGSGANQAATQQAIVALMGRPFPLARKQLEACPAFRVYLPAVLRNT